MRRIQLAELRDSWPGWLGVSLGFIATNFALALAALVALAGLKLVSSGVLPVLQSAALVITPIQNLVFCTFIGAAVIGTSTSLVVDSRRGSLARLALNGATPRQVVSTILTQLVVVSVACSVIGDVLAFVALEPALVYLTNEREEGIPVPPAIYAAWPVLAANVLAVGVAVLGGWRQARKASLIPPVEALRVASTGQEDKMTTGRWVAVGVGVLLVALTYGLIPVVTSISGKETISNLMMSSMFLLIIMAMVLTLAAPVVVGPITRLWTTLVPSFEPSWHLARTNAIVKATRTTKSVVPVMMTVGLSFGMVAISGSMQATLTANGFNERLEAIGPATTAVFLALSLLVALSGGIGSLIMMSKQRVAELALSGVFGTTPAQRVAMPIMEAMIIAITGLILAAAMTVVSIGFLAIGIPAADYRFGFAPSWATFGLAFGVSAAITVAATVLPTLPSLRRPEPKVIARLVAE